MSAPEDRILDRVAKLLAQADHPNTGDAERDAFLAKADKLMGEHMITEAMLRAAQKPEERRKPVVVEVTGMFDRETVYGNKMDLIARQVARTVGVKMVTHYSGGRRVTLVGFDEDVRWMQMLFMNIQVAFVTKLNPKWDAGKDTVANVVQLRESGASWSEILNRAVRAGAVEQTWTLYDSQERRNARASLKRAYERYCDAVGVEPVQTRRHEAFRHTYAEAFTVQICARLEEMAEARKVPGTELVLRSVQEDVLAAMWEAFPSLHPDAQKAAQEAREKAEREADEKLAAELAAMTPRQRLAYEKEQTRLRDKEARESDRYWRAEDRRREKLYDTNGGKAGRAAANAVNLNIAETVGTTTRQEVTS